ncbi:MAG: hypothetical protein EOO04_34880 [Chitinophagaceae bacterium]|nr:MAG: hypothetical protein EOO04_34880 [Chitinophagaceae bacterium]
MESRKTGKQRFVQNRMIFLLVLLFLATVIYIQSLMFNHDLSGGLIFTMLQLLAFFVLGVFSVFFLQKYYGNLFLAGSSLWPICVLEAMLIGTAIAIIYFFTGIVHLLLAVASVSAFLLPVVIYEAFRAFQQMPGVAIVTWQPGNNDTGQRVQYKKNMDIRFRLTKRVGESGSMPTLMTETVSEYDLLGPAFDQMLGLTTPASDQDIDKSDESGRLYEWCFFMSDAVLGKRWLNPFITIRMNKITPHSLIIVKRIKTTDL